MKKVLLFAMMLLVATVSFAQQKVAYTEFDLPNGLHVILHQDNSTPIVAISVMYHVGSKNEDPSRTGFAHFFEHLLFEGSKNIERGEYDKYVENAGGTLNANTFYDRTFYYEILPSNQLELGLWLESERMLHAKIDDKGIETQRQVVKEERRQRIDNQPYGSVLEQTMKRAYKDHPYKWPVIGYMEHIDAASKEDFKTFYETFYVPNNAVVSIAGDLEIEEAKALVTKYFGGIPKGKTEIPRPTLKEGLLTQEVRDTVYDNIQLPAVIMAYRTPEQGSDDYYAVNMLSQLLSQGQSSRLKKELVDAQQKALFVGSFPLPLEDPGVTIAYAISNMGVSPQELEQGIEVEFERVKKEAISDREFQKLKNQIESDFVGQNSSVAGIAENLANYHMYFGNTALINEEINRHKAVTKDDLMRVAKKYFDPNNRVVLYYLPKPAN